ncbi:MAG: DUF1836 domain-containing protein [Intestinimonas sp.]|jgi:hypothetical protein|nr:DUF1836 domain-containing protein [Intestinimonas sp.]
MEELGELKHRLEAERPMAWDSFPDIGLYMDQVIFYIARQLITYTQEEQLTPAMVNNYIKDGLLPRAEGKKYNRAHLAALTAICALKPVLSVREIGALLEADEQKDPEQFYQRFCGELDGALSGAAEALDPEQSPEELPALALRYALRSYADRLACERILSLISPPGDKQERHRKRKQNEK